MATSKMPDLKKLGICIKSKDTTVEYQNSKCQEICGDQAGQKCEKGCILKLYAETAGQLPRFGFRLYRNMAIDNQIVDCIIAQDGEKIITLLLNSQEFINNQINLLKKYSLSVSEVTIIKKFLEGYSNSEIAAQSFISKSTLRTHLNNIYKKLPDGLKESILAWHFGSEKNKK